MVEISAPRTGMVLIPGGTFTMGSDRHYAEEAPAHRVTVESFWIDRYAVTNAEFGRFIDATGYVTLCERRANPADYPGADPSICEPASCVFVKPVLPVDMSNAYNWWRYIFGANWRHPEGPESSIDGRDDEPVVHVAFEDVQAYAAWVGKSVPTEAQWEFAARGGLEGAEFAWGDELTPDGKYMANTWQGNFPHENLCLDGFDLRAPVGSFSPNGYGLYDMIGNVWEWTRDWHGPFHDGGKACCGQVNPHGGKRSASYDASLKDVRIPRKVIKGGSFLCSYNYCRRYRPAARMAQAIDSSTNHLGFRLCMPTI
jgi:sulfatase modifying factor 1